MNKTETKTINIDGENYSFHISYDYKNHKDLIIYLKVLYEDEFRKLENGNDIIEKFIHNYLYEELGEYFILKTSTINENDEFQATFEVIKSIKTPQLLSREVNLNSSDEKVKVYLEIEDEFQQCEFFEKNPFNLSDSISPINPLFNIYKEIVLIGKIRNEEDKIKVSNMPNSGEAIIYKCFNEYVEENFGSVLIFRSISQRSCSHFEVQTKYKIIPIVYK